MPMADWKCRFILLLSVIISLAASLAWGRSFPATGDPVAAAQQRWGSAMQGYVTSGCLHGTSASTSVSLATCRAFALETTGPETLRGFEELTARTITYSSGDGTYWLVGRANPAVSPVGWTCVAGTAYCWQLNATRPAVPTGTVLLSQSTVAGGAITVVYDWRADSPGRGAPANLRAPLFGAVADCTADTTAAVQAWINNAAVRNVEAVAPAGCYEVTRLWLNYDAANNPAYPVSDLDQGDTLLRGEGSLMKNTHSASDPTTTRWPGTIFKSTHTTAPMLNAYSLTGGGAANALRGLRLEQLALVQSTTSVVVQLNGANSESGLRHLFIEQQGTGGGLELKNTFLSWAEDVFVITTNAGNTGVGVHVYNDTTAGGVIRLTNVTGRAFGTACVRVGTTVASATRLQSVTLQGVQGTQCPTGIDLWGAGRGVLCQNCYVEGVTDYGINIRENPQGVTIQNSWIECESLDAATDACIRIGGGGATLAEGAKSVSVLNTVILTAAGTLGYGIWRDVSTTVSGAALIGNDLTIGPAMTAGIYCGVGGVQSENSLVIMSNNFQGGGTNLIDLTCRDAADFIQHPSAVYLNRRVNFGQGSTLASAAAVTIPGNGNVYNLTGNAAITTFDCSLCTAGAMVWFFVAAGNAPVINEGGNILLDDTLANTWTGAQDAVIGFVFNGTNWLEMHRKDD